ncbi:MAG: glycosyl transferase [Acidimicrobiales bacterium]|nr:MAG: glycosyl transferase [Acidimicrobiales bacterium]
MPEAWFMGVALVTGFLLFSKPPLLPRQRAGGAGGARVAVVIPARNAQRTLPFLLADLLEQTQVPEEIVVVDDSSSDATVEVARRAGATVIEAGPLPEGWTGKAHACQKGADATSAPLLVFLDADVRLAPDAVERMVACSGPGRLVSVAPHHRVESPYEHLSLPFNVVSWMGTGFAAARPFRRARGAFGPCLVIRRSDYERIGGHAAVTGDILDDVALAERAVAEGLRNVIFAGSETVRYRMYPDGVRSLVEGWTKNIAAGGARVGRLRSLAVALWIGGLLSASLGLLSPSVHTFGWYAAFAAQVGLFSHRVGNFRAWASLAHGLLFWFFVAIFLRSAVRSWLLRRVTWRGREVPLGSRAP